MNECQHAKKAYHQAQNEGRMPRCSWIYNNNKTQESIFPGEENLSYSEESTTQSMYQSEESITQSMCQSEECMCKTEENMSTRENVLSPRETDILTNDNKHRDLKYV